MGAWYLRIGRLTLFTLFLIEILGNGIRGEEILVKDVPYLTQKAHID